MRENTFKYRTSSPCNQPASISWSAGIVFLGIAVVPMLLMVVQSFTYEDSFSLSRYQMLFFDSRIVDLLAKSVAIAIGATTLSVLFGLPLAICLVRADFVGRKFACICYLIPLFIPPHIHALAWIYLLGEKGVLRILPMELLAGSSPLINLYTPTGAAIILFLAYCPIFVLTVMTGLSQIDRRAEEAASFHASSFRVWRRITLPLLSPYLVSGAVFVFIFSFFNYGVPSMLRVVSFPVEILTRFSAFYDEAGAAALSMPMIVLAIVLLLFHKKLMVDKSIISVEGASRTNQCENNVRNRMAPLYIWGYILVTVIMPLVALLIQAGSLKSFTVAFKTSATEILTSLGLALVAASLATVLAYYLCRTIEGRTPGGRLFDILSLLPLAFPAPLFGIGLIHLWNRPATQAVYASSAILVIAYIARFVPFGVRMILANIEQISPTMREAACLHQTSSWRRLLIIDLPLVKRGLAICWIVVFIFSMGELGATLLLIPAGLGTLSLKIYTLMHYGAGPLVAALSVILILASLCISAIILRVLNTNNHEN